jgi:predicted MFS family arabinose efflux permease
MRRALWVLAAGNFVVGCGAFAVAGLTLQIADDFGVTSAAAVQLLTVYALCYGLTSPFLAALAARHQARHAVVAALAVCSIGNLLAGTASSIEGLWVGRLVTAAGAALFTPLAYACAANLVVPERRARALGFVMVGLTISNVVGLPAAAAVGAIIGWRWVFFGVAGIGCVVALALSSLALPQRHGTEPPTTAALGGAMRDGALLMLLAVSLLQYAALFALFAFLSPIAAAGGAIDGIAIAWLLFLFGCGTVAGSLCGGWAADRWRSPAVVNAALSLLVPTAALFPLACHSTIGASVAAFSCGMVGLVFMAPQQHRLVSVPNRSAPMALALNVAAIYLGGAVGAGVCGALANLSMAAIGLGAALFAAAALLFSMMTDRLLVESRVGPAGPSRSGTWLRPIRNVAARRIDDRPSMAPD